MPPRLRIIFETPPNNGAWNMALDESLLENALLSGDAVLRWYRWSEPTLSLGYFQTPSDSDPSLASLPVVRRLSGGGAILHHHEWTYSCTLPPAHPLTGNPHDLYLLVHNAVIQVLSLFQFEAYLRGNSHDPNIPDSFLCFQRGDPCDLLCNHKKILGSAQRRRRGAVLQHGSLILRTSPHAPHIPGLFDLTRLETDEIELGQALASGVARLLDVPTIPDRFSPAELDLAEQLFQSRYSKKLDWNRPSPGSNPPS